MPTPGFCLFVSLLACVFVFSAELIYIAYRNMGTSGKSQCELVRASVNRNTSAGSPERMGKRRDMRHSKKNELQRSEGLPQGRGSRLLKEV